MPYATLEALHEARLPLTLTCPAEIDAIRSYVAAGLVLADIPAACHTAPGQADIQPPVVVHALTTAGRKTVEKLRANRSLSLRRQPAG